MVMFRSYVSLPEGKCHQLPLNHHFPLVFLWCSYGWPIEIMDWSHQLSQLWRSPMQSFAKIRLPGCPLAGTWSPTRLVRICVSGCHYQEWEANGNQTWGYGFGSKPCIPGEHQNSWFMLVFTPLTLIMIGFDTHPYINHHGYHRKSFVNGDE